jgi:hypothetical protein
MPAHPPAPRGDVLSCFGTAIAQLLDHLSRPHRIFMGCQLATGVRPGVDAVEFRHYHTPLDSAALGLAVTRHQARSAGEATAGIVAALDRDGAVVLTGTNDHLPWVNPGELGVAAHWVFAAREVAAERSVRVTDPFEWIDDAGEHHAYRDTRAEQETACLAEGSPLPSPYAVSRDRWAFGSAIARPDGGREPGWYWLTAAQPPQGCPPAPEAARELLSRTARPAERQPGGPADGWQWDEDAFGLLAEFIEDGRDAPDTYLIHNDLWVAARCRALFATALAAAPAQAAAGDLTEVTSWADSQIIPAWTGLLRLLRYNAGRVARGRAPRGGAGAALLFIARQEQQLRLRLGVALAR